MPHSAELERGLEAFRRLLSQAHDHEEARVDAIVALCQRPVIVPQITSASAEGFRTVMTRENIEALPMFTDEAALRQCALHRGWVEWQEPSCMREISSRHALRWAHAHGIDYVVIDLGMPYSIEINKDEFEPVLTPFTDVETAGPYAATGTLSEQLVDAIRHHQTESPRRRRTTMRVFDQNLVLSQRLSQQPMAEAGRGVPTPFAHSPSAGTAHRLTVPAPHAVAPAGARPASEAVPAGTWSSSAPAATSAAPQPAMASRAPRHVEDTIDLANAEQPREAGARVNAGRARSYTAPIMPATSVTPVTFSTTAEGPVHMTAPSMRLDDDVLEAWAAALRSYPQVEWACVGDMVAPTRLTQTAIGIAINPLFVESMNEIEARLRSESLVPQSIDILPIASPELASEAKERAVIFYPWKS